MKNTEMLNYLEAAADAAYQRMLKPSVKEEGYEYHRGKYDQMFVVRKDLDTLLKQDARALNSALDNYIAELQRIRKWTILPRSRRGLADLAADLEKMREPIKEDEK